MKSPQSECSNERIQDTDEYYLPAHHIPYASNVLQVENLGKVNFASSVCGYFLLFAGLGISSYAVREGSAM